MPALTYTTGVTQSGDIIGNAAEVAGPGDDLTVNLGVTLQSTAGDIILTAGDQAFIHGALLAAAGKRITITAGGGTIDTLSALMVDATISAGDVTLVADDMVLTGSITAIDTITLAPATSGTNVTLGNSPAPAGLVISNAALATLVAPTVTIGKDASGAITAGTTQIGDATIASHTLNLFAQGGITRTGALTLDGGNGTLNITAGGTVDLDFGLDVGAVGGAIASGHFIITESGNGDVIANAISTAGGEIVLQRANFSNLTVAGALTSHGGNIFVHNFIPESLALNADVDAGAGQIGLLSGTISQGAGRLVGSDLVAHAQTGSLTLASTTNAISGHVVLRAFGDISFTDTAAFTLGGLAGIHYTSVGRDFPLPQGALQNSVARSATLTAGGDITQAAGTDDYVFTGTLNLARLGSANPNVTLDNALNAIVNLGTVDLGSGALTLVDAINLTATHAITAGAITITTGMLTLSGGAVTTSGTQTYHGFTRLGATTTLTSHSGGVNFDQSLDLGGFNLTVDDATTGTFAGAISGNGAFIKTGAGTITLSAANSYTSTTVVAAGTLLVDGIILSPIATVASGATLGGHGIVGAVNVASGGTLAPGDSAGVLTTADVTLAAGAHLAIELGGSFAGAHDQLKVFGTVTLGGAILDGALVNSFVPGVGQSLVIIDNDGTDAINGTFLGLAEGALVNLGGAVLTISYHGGDGNDVALTALANHAPVNTVPGTQTVTAGADLAIAGLSIADQDRRLWHDDDDAQRGERYAQRGGDRRRVGCGQRDG